jgi:hypothetical protein
MISRMKKEHGKCVEKSQSPHGYTAGEMTSC